MSRLHFLIACSAVVIVGAACSFVPISRAYSVESRLVAAPEDDVALGNWLKSQPGVVAHTVHVSRQSKLLELSFVMTQNVWMNPPFPNVEQAASEFGYSIDPKGFQDQLN